jgi:transposase
MKKSYTAAFKAQVVLELLKETKTLAELSSEHGVHATVLREWKLVKRDSVSEAKAAHAREVEELYAEIGRLTTHVNFLKKKLPS